MRHVAKTSIHTERSVGDNAPGNGSKRSTNSFLLFKMCVAGSIVPSALDVEDFVQVRKNNQEVDLLCQWSE